MRSTGPCIGRSTHPTGRPVDRGTTLGSREGAHLPPDGDFWKKVQYNIAWRDGDFDTVRSIQVGWNQERMGYVAMAGSAGLAKQVMEEEAAGMAAIDAEERRRAEL